MWIVSTCCARWLQKSHILSRELPWWSGHLCSRPDPCSQTAPWPHPYSSHCGQSEPMVLAGYAGVFFFLWSHCGDEENHCGQQHPVVWQHHCLIPMPLNPADAGWPHGSVPSLGSPWKWGNPVWQSAFCGQTVAWSHPYSSQCGQSAPLVLAGYMGVFFFLVSHPSDEEPPMRPDSILVSSLLSPVWPVSTLLGVSWIC